MATNFKADVEAYYAAKRSYTELLKQAIPKKDVPDDPNNPRKPHTEDVDPRNWSAFSRKPVDVPEWEGPRPDLKEAAKNVAAMREDSNKGKSKIKKSEWTKIDKLVAGQ